MFGSEVKSVKTGNVSLKGSYVTFKQDEAFLINCHISPYKHSPNVHYDPTRTRKLLLKRKEIEYMTGRKSEGGLAVVPLEIYTKKGRVKLKIALARSRKKYDKREVIKRREQEREMRRVTTRNS